MSINRYNRGRIELEEGYVHVCVPGVAPVEGAGQLTTHTHLYLFTRDDKTI